MDDPSVGKRGNHWRRVTRFVFLWGLGCGLVAHSAINARADGGTAAWLNQPPLHAGPTELMPSLAPVVPLPPRDSVASPERNAFYSGERLPPVEPNFQLMSLQTPAPPVANPVQPFRLIALQDTDVDPEAQRANAPNPPSAADAKEPTYGKAPVSNAMQFLRTESVLISPGKWQADTGFAYTNFHSLVPVGVAGSGGNLSGVVPGDIRRRLFYTPLAFRYGLCERVQLFGVMPVGGTDTQVSTFGTSTDSGVFSQGDLTSGLNIHLLEGEDDHPDVIATCAVTAPTGAYSTPLFAIVPNAALGQGFWAISGQVLCINRYDPIIVFYGGGYRHLFERSFGGTPFAAGEQINYQMGVGFSVNDRVTLSTALQGFYITNSYINNAAVQGTNLEPVSLRFAATIARRDRIIEPFAMIGATPSAPAFSIGMTVTFY